MARFNAAIEALAEGKHVRRDGWDKGSTMYADGDQQLMRTPHDGATHDTDYNWSLDLTDITATDWQSVEPTSIHS